MFERIPLREVRNKYNHKLQIWNAADYWHFHLHKNYRRILKAREELLCGGRILNLGSASENYNISNLDMVYLDVAEKSLPRDQHAVCGDGHRMPFSSRSFRSIIAIGSVLNYCAPTELFIEVSRVIEEKGYFLFDFEQSAAYEHYGTEIYGKSSYLFLTDFNDLDETIWVFSLNHVKALLNAAGFDIVDVINIHTLSSLIWRLTESNVATSISCGIDQIFCNIPVLRNRSSNVFIIARRTTSKSVS
ncbi:methyltransferase domain-containing protein [Methylobacterium sp. NEAU 140]|uniref:methyltransferase domain-containing protein n=1 Tax=Methylobacterium sp. NEAU 140 TaxID=3064945 RepID=UPI0027372627|nr:methyltransferase domain-containing protein [Methylobacterium sp. NEAU 140]MDP4022705.1 methyltransferase domain-containing protein [Methylobacterium sp. NEAU 140]